MKMNRLDKKRTVHFVAIVRTALSIGRLTLCKMSVELNWAAFRMYCRTAEIHLLECIAQPNTTLVDCIVY